MSLVDIPFDYIPITCLCFILVSTNISSTNGNNITHAIKDIEMINNSTKIMIKKYERI